MAHVEPDKLSKTQQALIDKVVQWMLAEWPGLHYGEFESSDGIYSIEVLRDDRKAAGAESDGSGWHDS